MLNAIHAIILTAEQQHYINSANRCVAHCADGIRSAHSQLNKQTNLRRFHTKIHTANQLKFLFLATIGVCRPAALIAMTSSTTN